MASFNAGLQLRVKRLAQQTADQHRHLSALRREIELALDRGALSDVRSALERFELALAAHFDLEQGFFFPALHGLSRARSAELEAIEREHGGLLGGLRELRAGVERVSAERSREALGRWRAALADHEKREEKLVASIAGSA